MRRALTALLGLTPAISVMAFPALGQSNTIADIVIAASSTDGPDDNPNDYDILLAAVLADDVLTAAVSGTGDFAGVDLTVLAPKHNAFLRLSGAETEADAAAWVDDNIGLGSETLRDIVLYHVVAGASLFTDDIFFTSYDSLKKVETANGDDIRVRWLQVIDGSGQPGPTRLEGHGHFRRQRHHSHGAQGASPACRSSVEPILRTHDSWSPVTATGLQPCLARVWCEERAPGWRAVDSVVSGSGSTDHVTQEVWSAT